MWEFLGGFVVGGLTVVLTIYGMRAVEDAREAEKHNALLARLRSAKWYDAR